MRNLTKTYYIKAPRAAVYDALTRTELIENWSGSSARMNCSPNGSFSLWDGGIHGHNQEVTPEKIVQEWKEKKWNSYSRVEFHLHEKGGETELTLVHTNIPDQSFASINKGWDEYYLGPLKVLCEKNN